MSPEVQRLHEGIAALEGQRGQLGDEVVDAAVRGLKERLAALRESADEPAQALRQVTILFLDVVGSTTLGQHLDPEAIAAVMDSMLARGDAIVAAYGGKVLQYAGDNLLAAFGADRAAEDDAERAVHCGLTLLELGAELQAEVKAAHGLSGTGVRIGIHTGGVLLGGGVDKEGSIRGQAVNIAARMEQTAPPGALQVSHDTYRQVRGVFDVQTQPPLAIKGLDAPVQSYLVLRAKPRGFRMATRGVEGVETRLIGRDTELAVLQAAFERLVRPGAGLERIIVVSEAGVGKSRLLQEFESWSESRSERCILFQARATPQTRGQAYGLLRDLFAWRWQILDSDSLSEARHKLEDALIPLFKDEPGSDAGDAESHVHLLGQLIGFGYNESRHLRGILDDPRQIRDRGFQAAAQVLRRVAGRDRRPIVMLLDDLHWADDGSLDFIEHLVRVDRDVPMMMVALARPTLFELRDRAARAPDAFADQRIELRPLGTAASCALVRELLQKVPELPGALQELLVSRGGGNPFYMEELVKMLIDQGAIATSGERWSLDAERLRMLHVPPTLTGVLQARLDRLAPPERRTLQLASVIGLTFWDAALAHLDAHAPAQLPALRSRALVERKEGPDAAAYSLGEHAFSHQLLHQVIYDTVLKRVKQTAHARTADWLARHTGILGTGLVAAAAEHYERAGDVVNAAEHYIRAAAHMIETFAHESAIETTTRALGLLAGTDVERRWRLLGLREQALQMLGRREAQLEDIDAMAALADALPPGTANDLRRAEASRRRSDFAHRIGDWAMQEREARRAMSLAETAGDQPMVLRAVRRLAEALALQGDPAAGRALAEPALARAQALGLDRVESGLIVALTVCTDLLGDRVAGLRQSLQDLELNRRSGNRVNEAVALSNVGMSYLAFGAFADARRHLDDALRMHRALGNREIEGNTCSVLSELAWREGDSALSLRCAQAALDISRRGRTRLYETDALWSLGNAELALGRTAEAAGAFERSLALASEIGSAAQVLNALDGLARIALSRQEVGEAAKLVETLLVQAGDGDPCARGTLGGTYEHLIRLTIHRAWEALGDARADGLLDGAHALLITEADRIGDSALRESFLTRIAEHREIVARWDARKRCSPDTPHDADFTDPASAPAL
jgi:class 3 adenylate cyclase/tetratricopeptide (TPR) repeat protein